MDTSNRVTQQHHLILKHYSSLTRPVKDDQLFFSFTSIAMDTSFPLITDCTINISGTENLDIVEPAVE